MKKRTTKATRQTDLKLYISSKGEIVIGNFNLNLNQATELLTWLGEAVLYLTPSEEIK